MQPNYHTQNDSFANSVAIGAENDIVGVEDVFALICGTLTTSTVDTKSQVDRNIAAQTHNTSTTTTALRLRGLISRIIVDTSA